jgi:hypothetical protein
LIYLLVFEGELSRWIDTGNPGSTCALTSRLSETLPIPILDEWHESLWEAGQMERTLIVGLETGGDCQEGIPGAVDRDSIVEGGYYQVIEGTKDSHFQQLVRKTITGRDGLASYPVMVYADQSVMLVYIPSLTFVQSNVIRRIHSLKVKYFAATLYMAV